MNKNIILCDLDGTLADIKHRRHFVEKPEFSRHPTSLDHLVPAWKPNWPAFHKACVDDTPLQTTIDLVSRAVMAGDELWIVSGRSDEVFDETYNWLVEHVGYFHKVIMRKQGDYTPDDVLKKSWLDSGLIPKERVFCVFDDRDRVVAMWRNEGLTCYQVAPGDF